MNQFVFSIRYRASYGRKPDENEEINNTFDEICEWIEKNDAEEEYPEIGRERLVLGIEVLSSAQIKNTSAADCVYEMKCRILYYKRR